MTTSNQQPATSNQQPATSNQQPATSNQQPATSNQQPAILTHIAPMAIALAADAGYSKQVETLIKSICYHHKNVRFYILNKNFPKKLISIIQEYIRPLACEIINVHINIDFSKLKTAQHITETTFYRLLIENLPEERILYLDCDLIVDGDLSEFYYQDFEDNAVIAIRDMFLDSKAVNYHFVDIPQMTRYFNAGVLLINNQLWKETKISALFFRTIELAKGIQFADQDILNIVCVLKWKEAKKIYNFQTGARIGLYERGLHHIADKTENLHGKQPVIIHYTSAQKPWLNHQPILFADRWWVYYQMEWQAILDTHFSNKVA